MNRRLTDVERSGGFVIGRRNDFGVFLVVVVVVSQVHFQIVVHFEALAAYVAVEWPLLRVRVRVELQIVTAVKLSSANRAHVGLLARVQSRVLLVVAGVIVLLAAVVAFVKALATVNAQVGFVVAVVFVVLAAYIANERPFTFRKKWAFILQYSPILLKRSPNFFT